MKDKCAVTAGRAGTIVTLLTVAVAVVCLVSMSCSGSGSDRPTLVYFRARL